MVIGHLLAGDSTICPSVSIWSFFRNENWIALCPSILFIMDLPISSAICGVADYEPLSPVAILYRSSLSPKGLSFLSRIRLASTIYLYCSVVP